MSAIAGLIRFDGGPAGPLAGRVAAAMASRGPDGGGLWSAGAVALGHRMLRATPESLAETQPLASADGQLVLVMDGRIDNREELRRAFKAAGVEPRGLADAELVLEAYRWWGEDCPRHLLGDFAFAVWDARRQSLFCAVDPVGAKPLFYAHNAQLFAFASEEEALIGLPGVSAKPNEEQIAWLLVPELSSLDNPRAWLRDARGLLPGQSAVASPGGGLRLETYRRWEPGEQSLHASDRECEEEFLALFGEAVRCRLRGVDRPAMMMSGGMDSASIVAVARRVLREAPGDRRLQTYSAIADDPGGCIETRCILALADDRETDAHFVSVPSFQGMASAEDLAGLGWSRPHPCDNSILLPMAMCQAAARHGDRVLLHGVSGDLTLLAPTGYPGLLLRAGRWREAWRECLAICRNYPGEGAAALLFLRYAWAARMPAPLRGGVRRLRQAAPLAGSVIHPDFARRLGLAERLRRQAAETDRRLWDNQHEIQARLLGSPQHGLVLGLAGYERAAGRYGVDLRDPWADRRIVEFFLRLPPDRKTSGGRRKCVPRAALAGDLPETVRNRLGKEHLGWRFAARLMDDSQDFVARTLAQDLGRLADYADTAAVRARYEKYSAANDPAERQFVYEIMVLLLWLRRLSTQAGPLA